MQKTQPIRTAQKRRADEASLRLNPHHETLCCEKRKKVMAKGPARYETWTKLPKQSQINKASLPKNRAGTFRLRVVFARQGGGFMEKGNCHKSLVTWVQTPIPMKRKEKTDSIELSTLHHMNAVTCVHPHTSHPHNKIFKTECCPLQYQSLGTTGLTVKEKGGENFKRLWFYF